jgi:hypothetical protein
MRELVIESWQGFKFAFREDGTYLRERDGTKLPWKIIDNVLHYKLPDDTAWREFFENVSEVERFSALVDKWIEEIKFYDAVDSTLELE